MGFGPLTTNFGQHKVGTYEISSFSTLSSFEVNLVAF